MSPRARKGRAATRRSPARRRTRRPGKRRQRADDRLIGILVAVAPAAVLAVAVVNWLLAHWWVLVVICVLAVLGGGGWLYQQQKKARWEAVRAQGLRNGLSQLDALHHSRFEDAVRDLSACVQHQGSSPAYCQVNTTSRCCLSKRWMNRAGTWRDARKALSSG